MVRYRTAPNCERPGLLDHPALEQRGRRRLGADASDPGDLGPRDRLQVGDDRQRLGLGRGQRRCPRLGQQPSRGRLEIGVGAEREAAGELAHDQAAALELVVLAQALERGHDLVQLGAGGLGQRLRRRPDPS